MGAHKLQADIDAYVATSGNTVNLGGESNNTVVADVISERTSATGVTVDGVLLKDSQVTTDVINEATSATGVTADGVLLKDSGVTATGRSEFTSVGPAAAIAANGDTLTVTEALHAGGVIQFGKTTGTICTLPAATGTGNIYEFIIGVAATSNANIVKVANATDVFSGGVYLQQDTDSAGTLKMWLAAATDDTASFAGAATSGGLVGTRIICRDYKSGFWAVTVYGASGGGSEATCFSATVS